MKPKTLLLLLSASMLLTLACLGTPAPTSQPVGTPAATGQTGLSTAPAPTAIPVQFAGLKIAYILDGNIWLWDGGAPARQLTSDGDATQVKISDDGAVIAYQRGQSLWAVNADGSSPRLLVDIVGYASPILPVPVEGLSLILNQFDFQPSTHWVYFSSRWEKNEISLPSNDLHRVDADSPIPQVLLPESGGKFTFSPDGSLLVLSSRTDLAIIHAEGGNLVNVLSSGAVSTQTDFSPQIVWLSNGTGFYTVLPAPDVRKNKYYFIPVEGAFSAQLAEFETVPVEISAPIISPDGLKVAYVRQTATTLELHVIEASTADTMIASYEGAPFLVLWSWSPDSKRVTFSNAHPVLVLSAGIGIPPSPLTESITPNSLRWVSADHFIFFREGELLIGETNNSETISIASGFSNQTDIGDYDFTVSILP
jgi:hypothetical protein